MRTAVLSLLLAAVAIPAYAGHGTIEETDEAIIVEYNGDASGKAVASNGQTPVAAAANRRSDAKAASSQPTDGDDEAKAEPRRNRKQRNNSPRSDGGVSEE